MRKSPQGHSKRKEKLSLPRISLPRKTRQMQLSIAKRSITQQMGPNQPHISAKSWIIYHLNEDRIISEYHSRQRRQIASLTKIMTAICVVQICRQLNIFLNQTLFRISYLSTNIGGTLANLPSYQWISIEDCLFGLLLPSGNDAALVLAQNIGALLLFKRQGQLQSIKQINSLDLTDDESNFEVYVRQFVNYMNKKSKQFGLKSTYFVNPHGLDNYGHYSTCEDILIITTLFLKYQLLSQIANSKYRTGFVHTYKNKNTMIKNKIYWLNTNKLLGKKGCKGVKTGFTKSAGGCLSTLFEVKKQQYILIIVMGSKTSDDRFLDTSKLLNWGLQQLYGIVENIN